MQHTPRWHVAALAMTLLLQDPAAVFAQRASNEAERIEMAIDVPQQETAQGEGLVIRDGSR